MFKTIRKSIAVILALCLVISLSATAFADQSSSEKLSKKELEARKIVQDIANGSDTLVGNGVKLHATVQEEEGSEGDITPQWASGGWNHTHQFLAARGITILENDKTWNIAQHLYEDNGTNIIMEYADKPDEDEIGVAFAGHFYDPYTGQNYLGQTSPTAKTNFLQHTANAVNNFSSNKTYAWQELGRAIHYLSDLNESHHASNMVAVITNHAEYESWVDARRTDYGITSSSKYNDYSTDSFVSYCNKIADDSAKNAYTYRNAASASELKDINYDFAAENTLPYNQQEIAAYLYRFLKAVNEI